MLEAIAFYFFLFLSIVACLVVVTTKHILYALTALASGMICMSSFFFLLGAEFLGVVQIAVYTGAVVVMYAFGMMFVDTMSEIKERYQGSMRLSIMIVASALLLVILFCAPIYQFQLVLVEPDMQITSHSNVFAIGKVLFARYLIAFEIVGVLLLVALIAGIALGIRQSHKEADASTPSCENTQAHLSHSNMAQASSTLVESHSSSYPSTSSHRSSSTMHAVGEIL